MGILNTSMEKKRLSDVITSNNQEVVCSIFELQYALGLLVEELDEQEVTGKPWAILEVIQEQLDDMRFRSLTYSEYAQKICADVDKEDKTS